jgi:hypothetical protein
MKIGLEGNLIQIKKKTDWFFEELNLQLVFLALNVPEEKSYGPLQNFQKIFNP